MSCTSAPRSKWATSSSEWDLVASSPTSEHFYSGPLSILTPAVTHQELLISSEIIPGPRIAAVDADAQELIPIASAAIFPCPSDSNRILCDPAEPITQFLGR